MANYLKVCGPPGCVEASGSNANVLTAVIVVVAIVLTAIYVVTKIQ